MTARSFFYVSAGLLCIATAFQIAAKNVSAQGAVTIEASEFGQGSSFGGVTFVVGRTFYHGDAAGASTAVGPPVPGVSPIIATRDVAGGPAAVLLGNGDVYFFELGDWTFQGNVLGGATSTLQSTFGAVKTRYH